MDKKAVIFSLILFLVGWLSNSIYTTHFANKNTNTYNNVEKNLVRTSKFFEGNQQYVINNNINNELLKFEELEKLNENEEETKDRPSPYNRVKKEQIFVYDDEVIIKVKNPEWAVFTDTKSMDPVIDSTSKAIEIVPKSEEEIHVGDIVAYKSDYKDGIVAHRVVEVGYDAFGWYARLKGDNNNYIDPGKVRFEQVKRVVIAIIY